MYSIQQLVRGLMDPRKAFTEMNRRYHNRHGTDFNPSGIDIFEEDWDTLILLDACRFDEFQRNVTISGALQARNSRGATSAEFIRGNFAGKQLYDVVYVSANAWFPTLEDEIDAAVHDFVLVDRDAVGQLTSRPETVTERAIEMADEYPHKRLIVHYMQPHQPYLGASGETMEFGQTLAETVEKNDLSRLEVRRAYRENLELALAAVERLQHSLTGKTVISSDHGEHLGERERPIPVRFFGHMDSLYTDELVTVPWHVLNHTERRRIVAEEPTRDRDLDLDAIEQNLKNLGYRV